MSTANKLTYLNTTKTKIREGLNSLGADLDTEDTFRSYADAIEGIYEDYPKITGEGESLSLDNTKQASMQIEYKGQTSQVQYTGKNLFDSSLQTTSQSGITCTANNDGTYTLNGTATSNVNIDIFSSNTIPAGTYKVVGCPRGGSNTTYYLATRFDGNWGNRDTGSGAIITFTNFGKLSLYIASGVTFSNAILKPMITADTSLTYDDYEPYTNGASPNPDYPQDIQVVSGDNYIDICGKNYLDLSLFNNTEFYTISGNNVISNKSDNRSWSSMPYIILEAGTYTIISKNTMKRVQIGNISTTSVIVNGNSVSYQQFTLNETTKVGIKLFGVSTDTYPITYEEPMLLKGAYTTYPTTYEPYIGNSYPIYLGVENLFDKDNDITIGKFYTNTGTIGDDEGLFIQTSYIQVSPNTQYTFKANNDDYFRMCEYDNNKTFIQRQTAGQGNTKTYTYTTTGTTRFIRISCGTNNLTSIELTKGNTPQTISSTPIELCKIGDYQDYIYKENKKWYLHKEIGKVVLNGSNDEIWSRSGATTETSFVGALNLQITGIITKFNTGDYWLCDKFTYGSLGVDYKFRLYNGDASSGYVFLGLTIPTTLASDINAFRTWLGNNNVTLYYVLKEPIATEITDTTLINQLEESKLSYISQTNISQENNDLPFILDVKALRGE